MKAKIFYLVMALVLALPLAVVALPLATPAVASPAELHVGTGYPYATITDALADAVPYDTIIVHDGTYSENLVVNKALTLQAAAGESPVIDGGSTLWVPAVHIQAADVTFQGFTIQHFNADAAHDLAAVFVVADSATITDNTVSNITTADPQGEPYGIGIDVSANDVSVTGNQVHDVDSIGIRVRARFGEPATQMSNISVEDNEVYETANSGVLVVGNVTGVAIRGNDINGSREPTPYSLFVCHGPDADVAPQNVTIEDNHIHHGYGNVVLAGASQITIRGNTIEDAITYDTKPGKNIYILDDYLFGTHALSTDIQITNNNIRNGAYGVRILNTGAADPTLMVTTTTINFNNIYGNTDYGVENNIEAAVVDATLNWWGHPSGPRHEGSMEEWPTNPRGEGDAVSDNVDYVPWLTRPFETVLEDNIAYFGIPMLYLSPGWNIISTPVALDPACDTWGEYVALGEPDLHLHATSPAYSFDGATQVWVALTGSYVLRPCDAIYVRMAQPDVAPILFSPNVSVPSKELYPGWNLVGLAWLPAEEGVYGLPVNEALASAEKVTGDLTGYVQVVCPPVNPHQSPWIYMPGDTIDPWEDPMVPPPQGWMVITSGYWVFMLNPGTLAGFTFTPMSLGPW